MSAAPIDVDIGGTLLRLVCDDESGARVLRSALGWHLVDEPAPLGFYLKVPTDGEQLYVLLDRSGLVLGRTRRLDDCLAILGGHLSAFLPAPEGTTRFRMRALVDREQRVTLALPPLLQLPPLVERRLESAGHRSVDRMVVDIDRDRQVHLPHGDWLGLSDLADGVGHVSAREEPATVDTLLSAGRPDAVPSRAQIIAAVATSGSPASPRDAIMDVSEALSDVEIEHLDPGHPDEIYHFLRQRSCSI